MTDKHHNTARRNLPDNIPKAQIPDTPPDEATLSRWFLWAGLGPIPDYFKRDWSKKETL